ncbi:MAG: nuclear transport factor 2 family protein [Terriglobales bacterium]
MRVLPDRRFSEVVCRYPAGTAKRCSVEAGSSEDAKEILRLERLLQDSWLKHDVAAVGAIVADDFESWSLKGKRHVKADLLKSVEKNREEATRGGRRKSARLRRYCHLYRADHRHSQGRERRNFEATTVVTALFLRRNGKWQMVQNHDSLIQK